MASDWEIVPSSSDWEIVPDVPTPVSQPAPLNAAQTMLGQATSEIPFGDVIAAGSRGIYDSLFTPKTFSDSYDSALDEVRGYQDAAHKMAPITSTIGDLGGSLAMLPNLGLVSKAEGALATAKALALEGGTYGAGIGFESGRGGFTNRIQNSAISELFGIPASVVGGGALIGAGKGLDSISSLFSTAKKALVGASPEEVAQLAGSSFKDTTGLTPQDILESIPVSTNPLDALKTTAELTGNAGVAQLEKTLARESGNAELYNQLGEQRNAAREGILNAMTPTEAVNKEGLGTNLIFSADAVNSKMADEASNLWSQVPRDASIDITNVQDKLHEILDSRQAGLPANSKVRTLVDQLTNPDLESRASSGALQDIRSDALALTRDANLTPYEDRILNTIQGQIDHSMNRGLSGDGYNAWAEARDATLRHKEAFGRGTVGGYATSDNARPATVLQNALKGDSLSVNQLKTAIDNDPALINDVKRGILDSIPRNVQDEITPAGMKKFVSANEGGLRELFGDSHLKDMKSIVSDLQSEAGVQGLAFRASKGNSITSQAGSVAQAIKGTLKDKIFPGGPVGKVLKAISDTAEVRTTGQVNNLLFRASLDPTIAMQLAKPATAVNISRSATEIAKYLTSGANKAISSSFAQSSPQKTAGSEKTKPSQKGVIPELFQDKATSPKPTATSELFQPKSEPTMDPKKYKALTEDIHAKSDSGVKKIENIIDQDPFDAAVYEMESSRDPGAKNPESSASGGFQLLKGTAKNLGVKDVFDLKDNYGGFLKLKQENIDRFKTNDPGLLYAAHYLGAPVLEKYIKGKPLSSDEQAQVTALEKIFLPRFMKIYAKAESKTVAA